MKASWQVAFCGLAIGVLLGACSTSQPGPGSASGASAAAAAPAPVVAPPPPPPPSPRELLDGERQRLGELFKGTPVVFVTTSEGNLRATVPRKFCFDAASAKVRAPLAAVLDRLAKSQAATGSTFRVAAPSDPKSRRATLAQDRANAVRDYLARQGIAPARLRAMPAPTTEQLELFVMPTPSPA